MRLRRSLQKMKNDPLTMVIALDMENKAKGIVYFDDEESFEYQKGIYSLLEINYNNKEIEFKWSKNDYEVRNNIEKIIIVGENDLDSISLNNKAEVYLGNNKYDVEVQIHENKIEIIRLNKYIIKDLKKIKLK